MRRALVSLVLVASAAACDANVADGPASADLVIANATIVDVEAGELVPGRTIFVEDGRIVGIVEASRAAVPDGAREVVAHGVTTVRNLHTTVDTALELTSAIKRRVADGDLLGPRFLANGPISDGYPASWPRPPCGSPG